MLESDKYELINGKNVIKFKVFFYRQLCLMVFLFWYR
jgi:hypothetical protein